MAEGDYVVVQSQNKEAPKGARRKYDVSALIDGKVLVIGDGYRAKNTELSRVGLPFARAGNIGNGFRFVGADCFPADELHRVGEKISQPGDTVFTSKGTVGRFAFVKNDTPRFVYSPQLSYWRSVNSGMLDPRFLYYWMTGGEFLSQFKSVAGQTDMAEYVSLGDQRRMYITLPPIPEQRAIAHVLGTLDDKIELNRRMNETLEAMARALFKSWFVDFDPVRAKMEGRWRRGESLPGLSADLYDLFPDRLIDSELGEIPEGWGVKTFGELLDHVIGGDWGKDSPDPINSEGVSIIRGTDLPNLRNGGIGAVPFRYTTEKKVERRMLQDGDIVIEVSGGSPSQPTGRSMIITRDILARFPAIVVCASFCRRFRPRSWTEGLLAYQHLDYLNSVEKMWEYQLQSTGISNFQTKRFLDEELILWPNDSLTIAFSDLLSPIVRHITNNESKTLAETRDALLPGLVGGEVGVGGRWTLLEFTQSSSERSIN